MLCGYLSTPTTADDVRLAWVRRRPRPVHRNPFVPAIPLPAVRPDAAMSVVVIAAVPGAEGCVGEAESVCRTSHEQIAPKDGGHRSGPRTQPLHRISGHPPLTALATARVRARYAAFDRMGCGLRTTVSHINPVK